MEGQLFIRSVTGVRSVTCGRSVIYQVSNGCTERNFVDGQLFIRSVTGVRSVTLWTVSYLSGQ